MRFLVATAGLLVLAGSAIAGRPTVHTLRKSRTGPIAAIAQNNGMAAWLTSGGTRSCNAVHVLSPGNPDRSLPQPASPGNLTCNWNLTDGQPQLAIASRMSTALWTLHETESSSSDWVIAASLGGPERRLKRLAHANDGTGDWLGDVAGAGRTLAYSWEDVEYVDPSACLSGGSCKQKIADGGIRLVGRTDVTPLPGAQPALQLAAAAGRIAYVPATGVTKTGRPTVSLDNTLPIVDAVTGDPVAQVFVRGIPTAIALSPNILAVLTTSGSHDRISWFSATDGTKLGDVLVSQTAAPLLAASDRLIVYRVGRVLHGISTRTGHNGKLVKTGLTSLGLSLAHGRLLWAENQNHIGRLRALSVQ